jgi:hypothetical protein
MHSLQMAGERTLRATIGAMLVLDLIKTLAAVAVPVVVAVIGYRLNQRLKLWEATQWRNQELIKARLQYYDRLAPLLNDLMCYLTFIGRWKELTPPDVVALKRDTDRLFLSVAPLFSQRAVDAYRDFIRTCFGEHAGWGRDALIRSVFVRRREAAEHWDPAWEKLFTYQENDEITKADQVAVQESYNRLLTALAEDIELSTPRDRYVTTRPSAAAH